MQVVGVVVVFAVVIAVLFMLLNWYVAPTKPSERKDLILALAQILGGTALLSGLYFTWRSLQVNREGQITDRFTRAIDQLGATDDDGNPRLEVRLGGIYALERIDKDSPQRAYHSTVMEVLTAYVRENAPWPPKSSKSSEEGVIKPPGGGDSVSDVESDEAAEQDSTDLPVRGDIQAILDVINRREEDDVPVEHRVQYLDLRVTDLRKAGLNDAHLENAVLFNANLQRAFLIGSQLEKAILFRADLRGALLNDADLKRADLRGALLNDAELKRADLQGALLNDTYLQGANLRGAKVTAEQLADTLSLQGAIMPDGSEHP